MRSELSTDEKRDHLRRRKELWEKRQSEIPVAHDAPDEIGYGKPPIRSKGFSAETAEQTGMPKSRINRLVADPKPIEPKTDENRSRRWRAVEQQANPGGTPYRTPGATGFALA